MSSHLSDLISLVVISGHICPICLKLATLLCCLSDLDFPELALKSHILSKASLYDGKDNQDKVPKNRKELKASQHSLEDDDEAFYDVEQYSTY